MTYVHDSQAVAKVLAMFKTRKAESGWTTQIDGDVKLRWKMYPETCRFAAYQTIGTFKTSKEQMVNKIWGVDKAGAQKNDPKVTEWKILQQGGNWKVIEQTVRMGLMISNRHVVFSQSRIDDDAGNTTYLVAHSVVHPSSPTPNGHVLTSLHMSVYEYVDNGNGTTTVTRITQVDPNGTIPEFVINMFTGGLVGLFNMWKHEE